ncbi:MAG TPA: hypothetical protein VKY89_11270 [Thermoanaerobaculia bacterium]|jgi:hypothetical protein|nr:hypothetical protein [Thermoanaerobaculia bacterium]
MKRNVLYLFMTLLLASVLAVLAQSPTSGNPGGSETKDPYGATLDHPNPGSAPAATGQSYNSKNINEGQTPATGTTTATTPSSSSSTDTSSTASTTDNSGTANANDTTSQSLPRTASDLPLLAVIGLLAIGGALTVRSFAKRQA